MKPATPNPPFGHKHPAATGRCTMPGCRAQSTHWHNFLGWLCRRHWRANKDYKFPMRPIEVYP